MAIPEVPRQQDMFTGDLVDVRTPKEKRQAAQREQPQQIEMYAQRELAQFGVKANPKMPISPKTRLELVMEDSRTEEEIERDRMKAAEALTYPLFPETQNGSKMSHPLFTVMLSILDYLQQAVEELDKEIEKPAKTSPQSRWVPGTCTLLVNGVGVLQPL